MNISDIEWTNRTWNPVTGCTKVSPGCKHCYAERLFPRAYGKSRPFTSVRVHPDRLDQPLRMRKPKRIFVNSMSDLFHEDVPDDFIDRVFAVMALCEHHSFQILTKRPERMLAYMRSRPGDNAKSGYVEITTETGESRYSVKWPLPNVWLGVSVEDQATADERIPLLLQTPAAVRFLSCEPLLGDIRLDRFLWEPDYYEDPLTGEHFKDARPSDDIDWVIAGSESGPQARPWEIDWFSSIRDQCVAARVPFFLKQLTEKGKKISLPKLDGEVWAQYPQSK